MFPRLLFPAALVLAGTVHASEDLDFFEKKVRPLLTERCLECHSADHKIKGGLRLDLKEGWAKGGDTGPAIVPGDLEKSVFIEAIRYGNRDLEMPPKQKLPAEEIAILEQWVKMGAPDPRTGGAIAHKQTGLSVEEGKRFWAYQAPKETVAPDPKDPAWPKGDLDRFILAAAEAAGVKPAPDASAEALVRRLYFNLAGLPPTPEQIDVFTASAQRDRTKAIETLVDGLLASPHFGERWGRHWLDLARFAESSGGGRTLLFKDAWRYRDYVIESINTDVPYDQFLREQLAGDLLPSHSVTERRRQITATAFLALGPTNYEEQEKQQLRYDVIDEQLEMIGRSLLGQTIGCARCHDHKFDPIPQRDYYALAGIFTSTRTLTDYGPGVSRWTTTPLPAEGAEEAAYVEYETDLNAAEKALKAAKAKVTSLSKSLSVATAKSGKAIPASEFPGVIVDDIEAKVIGDWKKSTQVGSFIGAGYLSDKDQGKGEKTVTFTPTFPAAGRYEVRMAYSYLGDRASNVRVNILHAEGEDTVFVDETKVPSIEGRFVSLGTYRFEKDGASYVLVSNEGTRGYVTIDALQFLPESESSAATVNNGANTERAAAEAEVRRLDAELKQLKKNSRERPIAMSVRDDEEIVDTAIRVRGVEKQRGEVVPRGFLQVALKHEPAALSTASSGRRELANWIASADNPLTARVFVNHVWAWLFGTGLVRTVDNFGTTGEKPSHPELLDHLTLRFIAEGWSLKKLVREIVLSRTWQLAAQPTPPARQLDPENRLWTHAAHRRLDAEQIRDTLLAASGELDFAYLGPNIGGAGDIDANSFSAQNTEYGYTFDDTRRSVYTPAFRAKRLELFETFDFADINQPLGQRNVSTVAPQALYLLNHPFVAARARAAAEQTLSHCGDDTQHIVDAFRETLGREPSAHELEKCLRFLRSAPDRSVDTWTQLHQALFASLDFRYLD